MHVILSGDEARCGALAQLSDEKSETFSDWTELLAFGDTLFAGEDSDALRVVFLIDEEDWREQKEDLTTKFESWFANANSGIDVHWIALCQDVDLVSSFQQEIGRKLPVEFWNHDLPLELLKKKLEFLGQTLEEVLPSADLLCQASVQVREVFFCDLGILNPFSAEEETKTLLSLSLSLSPEGADRGDIFFLNSTDEIKKNGEERVLFREFTYVTNKVLRDIYSHIQKDKSPQVFSPLAPEQPDLKMEPVVWIHPGDNDLDSVREFFPKLPIDVLRNFDITDSKGVGTQGRDFFEASDDKLVASFLVQKHDLKLVAHLGPKSKGISTFLGRPYDDLLGEFFIEWIAENERNRFKEMLRLLTVQSPLLNHFEICDAEGQRYFTEILADTHQEGKEELYILRLNPGFASQTDHLMEVHQRVFGPSQWPKWLLVPESIWHASGGKSELVQKLEDFIRRPEGSLDPGLWILGDSPWKSEIIVGAMAKGADSVWIRPLPFRLMARALHRAYGYPSGSTQGLRTLWSQRPRDIYANWSVKVERWSEWGAVLRSERNLRPGSFLTLSSKEVRREIGRPMGARVLRSIMENGSWRVLVTFDRTSSSFLRKIRSLQGAPS